jgi:integrase
MVRLQRWTGMRPGEVVRLKPEMFAEPEPGLLVADFGAAHKMAYRRRSRRVGFPPAAVEIVRPWLDTAAATGSGWVFRSTGRRNSRRGDRPFQVRSLGAAVRKAARAAGVPPWFPNQVRHRFATDVRERHGLDAAQLLLDHASVTTTQVYAEVADRRRVELVKQLGGIV